ncbi:MAG: bL35 family ribosomal protein [bacterium]|nr:bL35 family ribosomal protein [bacterium]MDZ4286250.1 bL35 family ribosomal protein [Candidatus Sungbacteria bacterium]
MSRKAVLKRIRITKNGKMLRRHSRQNHLNAKASRKTQMRQMGMTSVHPTVAKKLKRYIG